MSDKFRPTLPLDTKYYQQSYQIFSRSMDFEVPYEPWFNQVLGKTLRDKLSEHDSVGRQTKLCTSAPATKRNLRHMGVGSGSGELEIQILRALLEKFNGIYNQVIEPSTHQIDVYKKLVRNDDKLSAAVEFDWRQQTLEDHLSSDDRRGRGTFDVITSVHSIYYSVPMEETVPNLFDLLAEGGVMAIVLISDTDSLSQVQRHFLSTNITGYRYYTKQKLQSFLTANNISHQTIDVPRCYIDVTPCFDDSSTEGSLLVDFLSHMKHFRNEVPSELRGQFLRLLRQNAHTVGNKLLVTHDTSAVIVQRTNNKKFTKECGSNASL